MPEETLATQLDTIQQQSTILPLSLVKGLLYDVTNVHVVKPQILCDYDDSPPHAFTALPPQPRNLLFM